MSTSSTGPDPASTQPGDARGAGSAESSAAPSLQAGAASQDGAASQAAGSGPPLRALVMVLIAAAIVFAGLGFISLSDSGSDAVASPAPAAEVESSGGAGDPANAASSGDAAAVQGQAADQDGAAGPDGSAASSGSPSATTEPEATTKSASANPTPTNPTQTSPSVTTMAPASGGGYAAETAGGVGTGEDTAALQARVPVRVYNNSTVDGLAHDTAVTLENYGWTVDTIANYEEGALPASAVYYDGAEEKAAAEEIGARLGIPVKPRFDGISDASPGVIVILTAD